MASVASYGYEMDVEKMCFILSFSEKHVSLHQTNIPSRDVNV